MSWTIIWQTWVFVIGIFFVLPLIGSALISVVTTRTNQHLMRAFGLNAPLIFGWFGVMIHEISHAVMSIIFGHHVDKIKLLQNPFKEGNENRMAEYRMVASRFVDLCHFELEFGIEFERCRLAEYQEWCAVLLYLFDHRCLGCWPLD